jgi:hypothetical protein
MNSSPNDGRSRSEIASEMRIDFQQFVLRETIEVPHGGKEQLQSEAKTSNERTFIFP